MSYLVTVEGIDGCGKSSQIPSIVDFLREQQIPVMQTREPGGTPLGEALRAMLLRDPMHLETEALLMFAARREHLDKVIWPALAAGTWVVSDRFTDSSHAYQVGGRGLSEEAFNALENFVHPGFQPALTFFFDVPVEVGAQRMAASRTDLDRFELEKAEFHVKVREAYLRRARKFPARFRVIDATQTIDQIKEAVRHHLASFLRDR